MGLPSVSAVARLAWRHPRYLEDLLIKKLRLHARYRWLEDHPDQDGEVPMPLVFKVTLTYKCNLRCAMCYEWGDQGWCKQESAAEMKKELSWEAMTKLLRHGQDRYASYLLIGGEPLLYTKFREVVTGLRDAKRFSIVCTNGLLLDRYLDLIEANPYVTYLISLDGTQPTNDAIRGKGVYIKVLENIRRIKKLRRPPYVGIQFTVRPENVGEMYLFCLEMRDLGVDWVFFNPTWFINEKQGRDYEQFMSKHFSIMPKAHLGYLAPFNLDKGEYVRQFEKIRARTWPFQVSSYLEKPEDIVPFVDRPAEPVRNSFCYKQWLRMDVMPDGAVTPCALYPDLTLGNLNTQEIEEAWNSPGYARFRKVRRENVLPVCSKCNALYLYDARRKTL